MGVRPGTNFTVDDLDYIGREREDRYSEWGTAEVLTECRNRIATGQARDGISELGHLHRQLLQESDFHAAGRTLLKKLSPDEEAERFGFNGSYLPENTKVIILALEAMGISTSSLKGAIKLAREDKDTINWVTKNWDTFVEIRPEDALATADNGLIDVKDTDNPIHPDEKVERDEGYKRDYYRPVEVFYKSIFKESAERRKIYLKATLRTLQKCQHPEEVERELERNREVYNRDKTLITYWSPAWKEADRKAYLSSLHRRRKKQEELRQRFLDSFDKKGCKPTETPKYKRKVLDFESIRRKVWFCFDREREEKDIEVQIKPVKPDWISFINPKTGEVREEGFRTNEECLKVMDRHDPDPRKVKIEKIVTSPSLWDLQKSKEFCNLTHTGNQWNRVYEYTWNKMNETILWNLHTLRRYQDGTRLCEYIRRYQFRLDSRKLGNRILEKAKKAKTEKGRDLIRLLLSSCQYRLDKNVAKEIIKEISRGRYQCV